MPTKQFKIYYQVDNPTNNVEIKIDGVTKFNGTLANSEPIIFNTNTRGSFIEFDQDIDAITLENPTVVKSFSASVTNGARLLINKIDVNYIQSATNSGTELEPVMSKTSGTALEFGTVGIASQPLWNGEALLARYDFSNYPDSLGEIYVESGETVTFNLNVPAYSA